MVNPTSHMPDQQTDVDLHDLSQSLPSPVTHPVAHPVTHQAGQHENPGQDTSTTRRWWEDEEDGLDWFEKRLWPKGKSDPSLRSFLHNYTQFKNLKNATLFNSFLRCAIHQASALDQADAR